MLPTGVSVEILFTLEGEQQPQDYWRNKSMLISLVFEVCVQ